MYNVKLSVGIFSGTGIPVLLILSFHHKFNLTKGTKPLCQKIMKNEVSS